jgi:hypothetical protein
MKNYLLLLLIAVFTFSCETATPECDDNPAAGYLATADGKTDARDADPANLDIIDKYLDAHNAADVEAIFEMEADSTKQFGQFFVYGPRGEVLQSRETHKEFLEGWFDSNNPKWNTFFSYTMKVDGQVGEWVITGHTLTQNVEGEEVTTYDVADFYIEDGKVGGFWVYSRASTPAE